MLSTICIIYHILVSATLRVKMACLVTWLPSHATGKTRPLQSDSINLGWAPLATSFLCVFRYQRLPTWINFVCRFSFLNLGIVKVHHHYVIPHSDFYTFLTSPNVLNCPLYYENSFISFFYVRLLTYTPTPKRNLYSVARWWSWTYQNVSTWFPCHVWPILQILWKIVNAPFPYFASRRPWWR